MQNDIFFKLKALQSIEPEEAWKIENKKKLMEKAAFGVRSGVVLSEASPRKGFGIASLLPNHLAVSFASLLFVLTSSILTVGASQSSLPGEPLYSVKKMGEQFALAVASEENKPKVEIEQAGKRLEELAEISKKTSDAEQHKKVEQLVAEFESKVSSANARLVELNDKGKGDSTMKNKVASAAQVVNEQSEKYSDVLTKTTEVMPESVKDKVAGSVANAVTTTEKTNMSALLVIVETKKDDPVTEDETTKIQKKIEKTEETLEIMEDEIAKEKACSEVAVENSCIANDALNEKKTKIAEIRKQLEDAKAKMSGKDLVGSMGDLTAIAEKIENFGKKTEVVVTDSGTVAGDSTTDVTDSGNVSSGSEIPQSDWIESGVVDGGSVSE